FLNWLPGRVRIVRFDKHPEDVKRMFNQADLVVCLDFNMYSRIDDMGEVLKTSKADVIMIDHHLGSDVDCSLKVSFPEASSTCELLFRVVWQMGGFDEMAQRFAIPCYCGMMTDTGGFTFNSSRPEIFFIICQLLTKGIDKDKIYRNVYNNYSSWAIRLRGFLMSQKLNVLDDLHASYYTMTRKDMKDFHYVRGDSEGLVNVPLQIKGMKCSISLREDDRIDNRIWVSLRSVDDFSVEEMAKRFFNGGGHLNASGGKLDCTMDEAVKITKEAINYYSEQLCK
uniref:DHH family phosphoesterase n=1 Tax=Prevotella sp. TaxID=59823 RepID=UPI004025FA48